MSSDLRRASTSNVRTIAKNFAWSSVESVVSFLVAVFTSVAVARTFGPERLGYFNYVFWLTNITGVIGALGLPAATRKYMAEYIGKGELPVARAIFRSMLWVQFLIAALVVAVGLTLVFALGDPAHRVTSALLVGSMLPQMLAYIPSQANNARENVAANLPGSIAGTMTYVLGVGLTLWFEWGLTGIAATVLTWYLIELTLKLASVFRWLSGIPASPFPRELKGRVVRFSGQSMGLMLLNILIWDRSDILLLKALHPDIRQVAFFSVPFSLVQKIVLLPQTFAGAIGMTLMAQYGRGVERMQYMAGLSFKYVLFVALPCMLGLAALSGPAVRILYGPAFATAGPVLAILAVAGIGKALIPPIHTVFEATERQSVLIGVFTMCGALNIAGDILLIPRYGAVGAAVANTIAQLAAAAFLWGCGRRMFSLELPMAALAKLVAAAGLMAAAVWFLSVSVSPWTAALVGVVAGCVLFSALLRGLGVLGPEDRDRLIRVCGRLPGHLGNTCLAGVGLICGSRSPAQTARIAGPAAWD